MSALCSWNTMGGSSTSSVANENPLVLMNLRRFESNPIIHPGLNSRMGTNINGPSLIQVPDFIKNPLGKYYLYFAHHQGTYIRMAFADELQGPWKVHDPGVLDLRESLFNDHIASPDVHVIHESREIRMYFHGAKFSEPPVQRTRLAISNDGLSFEVREPTLGSSYWRAFRWDGCWYTLEMPGLFRKFHAANLL
jgi:hypothetical protein